MTGQPGRMSADEEGRRPVPRRGSRRVRPRASKGGRLYFAFQQTEQSGNFGALLIRSKITVVDIDPLDDLAQLFVVGQTVRRPMADRDHADTRLVPRLNAVRIQIVLGNEIEHDFDLFARRDEPGEQPRQRRHLFRP